jgi:hypothetical protein
MSVFDKKMKNSILNFFVTKCSSLVPKQFLPSPWPQASQPASQHANAVLQGIILDKNTHMHINSYCSCRLATSKAAVV